MQIWLDHAHNNPNTDAEDYEEMRSRNEDTEAIYEVNKLIRRNDFHNSTVWCDVR